MGYQFQSPKKLRFGAPFATADDPYEEYLKERAADTNRGGFGAGLGYLGEKIGLGFLQSVEGIWDYTAGGIAKILGADDFAERQFANDWVNYNDADEWFNPSEGWRVAGDVAGGIGTSLPAIAGVAIGTGIAVASGGTLSPVAAGIISGSIAGLGAAGVSTKEAYRQTGELGGKEFGYGALSGATEAGLELISTGIGTGTGRIVKSLSAQTAKETAQKVAKGGVKSVAWNLTKDFLGEAFEEGMSEILDPVYQRMTIDKDAQWATPQEVAYAALVGGLSGVIMGGTQQAIGAGVNTTRNLISGNTAVQNGSVNNWMTAADRIIEENAKYKPDGDIGTLFDRIAELRGELTESLAKTGGEVQTAKQKMLLGEMKRMETAAATMPYISRSVVDILSDPQAVVDKFNKMGLGKTITVEELTAGIDPAAKGRAKSRQILNAIGKNPVLTTLAIADATGHLMTGATGFTDTVLSGNAAGTPGILNQNAFNNFIETAKPEQMEAVSRALGVEDVSKLTLSEFAERVAAYEQNGGAEMYRYYKEAKNEALAIPEDAARKTLPTTLRTQKDGTTRYRAGGVDVAVMKYGENFRLYDYNAGELSRTLTRTEANKILRELKGAVGGETATARNAKSQVLNEAAVSSFDGATSAAAGAAKIDAYIRENVPDYSRLNSKNRQAVRQVVRQAQNHGVQVDTALLAARVAARSGLNISFDYVAGDGMNVGNSIILNPEAPAARMRSKLLAHELDHVLTREKGGKKLIRDAFLNIDEEKRSKIVDKYAKALEKKGLDAAQKVDIFNDEIASAYMEDIAADPAVWEYILSEKPDAKEKVLSFFKKAAQDYSFDEGMSREARKYLRHFKQMFDSFSERNFQGNASAAPEMVRNPSAVLKTEETSTPKKAFSDSATINPSGANFSENTAKSEKDVRYALPEAETEYLKLAKNPKANEARLSELVRIYAGEKGYTSPMLYHGTNHFGFTGVDTVANNGDGISFWASDKESTSGTYATVAKVRGISETLSEGDIGELFAQNTVEIKTETEQLKAALGSYLDEKTVKKYGNRLDEIVEDFISQGTQADTGELVNRLEEITEKAYRKFGKKYKGRYEDFYDWQGSDEYAKIEELFSGIGELADKRLDIGYALKTSGIYRLYANTDGFLEIDGKGCRWNNIRSEKLPEIERNGIPSDRYDTREVVQWASKNGYKGVIFRNIVDGGGLGRADASDVYAFFDPRAQVKSADTVTYDDTGSVIPLPKRFDPANPDIRYALPETVEKDVTERYGKTYRWSETGYILKDGTRLDLSGRRDGATGGYREMDHRDIFSDFDVESGTDAMIEFMSRGNIRVSPEIPGINLQAEPTAAQYEKIADLVERLGWKEKAFSVDFDNRKGETVDTLNYEGNVSARKVVSDIQYYFKNGETPQVSDLARFRYALSEREGVANYTEEQYNSFGWARAAEALSATELDDLYAKILARSSLRTFHRSARGESIIEVNDKPHTTLGTDNVFVFVKGKKDNFTISRVVRFDVQTETEMDNIRRSLYEGRSCNDTYLRLNEEKGLAREYRIEDSQSFAEYSKERAERGASNGETGRGTDRNNRGSAKYRSGYSLHVGEDGEITERFALPEEKTESKGKDSDIAGKDTENARADVKDAGKNTDTAGKDTGADTDGKKDFTERLTTRTVRAVSEALSRGMDTSEWRGKKLSAEVRGAEAVSHLFDRMITEPKNRERVAGKIADELIRSTVTARLYSTAVRQNAKVQESLAVAGVLGRYRGKLDLDGISAEVREKLGKRGSGFLLAYGAKENGVPVSTVADALADTGIVLNGSTDAELFAEMAELSSRAQKTLEAAAADALSAEYGADQNLTAERERLAGEALSAFEERGNAKKYDAMREELKEKNTKNARQQRQRLEALREEINAKNAEITKLRKQWYDVYRKNHYQAADEARYNREANRAVAAAGKIREWKTGAFRNASELAPDSLIKPLGRLAKVASAGNVNQAGTRRVIGDLLAWYQANAEALKAGGYFNEEAVAAMQGCSSDSRALTDAQWVLIEGAKSALEAAGVSFEGMSDRETYVRMRQAYTAAKLGTAFDPAARQVIAEVTNEKRLTLEELRNLNRVLSYFKKFTENYNKVLRDGKWQDATDLAKKYTEILQGNKDVRTGPMRRIFAWYNNAFGDPMYLCRAADGYESGFFTEAMTDFREGQIRAELMEKNLRAPLEKFLSENKKYAQNIAKETVNYHGTALTKPEAMQLYMTLKRDIGAIQVAFSGFTVREGKETLRLPGEFGRGQRVTMSDVLAFSGKETAELQKSFSATDLQYLSLLEEFYNGEGREIKRRKDLERLGYSNVSEGYYVPIESANTASRIDAHSAASANLTLQSFNRSTTDGAKNELKIRPANEVFDGYVRGLAQYAELSGAFETFDRLYNADVSGNARKPVSVKTEAVYVWENAEKYFRNLRDDIMGKSRDVDGFNRLFGKMRGAYAKAVLALNPKVLLTQFSSVFASASVLDADCIAKGMVMNVSFGDVDTYCKLAELRHYDKTAIRAQTLTDKVGGIGDKLMEPIGAMDRFVVNRLFGACQQQVQKNGGAKIGTEENKIAAGKLLETVIFETQQNTFATERTAGTRSGNEVMKTFTMFKADQIKVFCRILDACGETLVLRKKLKSGNTSVSRYELERLMRPENHTELAQKLGMESTKELDALLSQGNKETILRERLGAVRKKELQSRLKAANRRVRMSIGALVSSAVYMALVSLGFKWLYDRIDREDDAADLARDTAVDAFGNLFGGLPILSDVMSYFTDGYDVSSPAYDMFNDLTKATKGFYTAFVKRVQGEATAQDVNAAVRDVAFIGAQFAGLPLKNAYKLTTGITGKISTSAKYRMDDLFKNQNYRNDLSDALEDGDEKLADTLLSLAFGESGGQLGESGSAAVKRLLLNGYSALPRKIGSKVSVNGNEYELTDAQRELMQTIFSGAFGKVDELADNPAFYRLEDKEQEKALKALYDIYYDTAVENVLGEDSGNKGVLLSRCMDAGTVATVRAKISGMESDKNRKGETISGSKRKKVIRYITSRRLSEKETLLLIYGLGYRLADGEYRNLTADAAKKRLLRYILRDQTLSAAERARLAEQCGFTVKNGRIVSGS